MARSLRVDPEYKNKVKLSLQRNSYPSQRALAEDRALGLSLSTVKNFLSGKPVDYQNFLDICERLALDWQEIAAKDEPEQTFPEPLLDYSPFITGPPITHSRDFFGREKELKRLFNLLKKRPLQNAAIIGKRRLGKTSLLHYLKNITKTPVQKLRPSQKHDWLTNPENYKWIFVDFQDVRMQSREGLLGYILESLHLKSQIPNSQSLNLDNFMEIVSDNLHKPTVILLDEIGGRKRKRRLENVGWVSCLRNL
jgi:hypothetical protein